MASLAKVCAGCGNDVGAAKRFDDSRGNYYCEACWNAQRPSQFMAPPLPMDTSAGAEEDPLAASAAMVLVAVSKDLGPFHKLGAAFSVIGAKYAGPAYASPVAVYLVKQARQQSHGGGLVGALLSAALAKDNALSTCNLQDLPESIQNQIDPKNKLRSKEVVILSQTAVSYVKAGWLNNQISFTSGKDKFGIVTGLFSQGKARRALRDLGWQLNCPLTPTTAPIHDMRTPEQRRNPTGKPLWQRALLVAAAVIVIILVIALRLLSGH